MAQHIPSISMKKSSSSCIFGFLRITSDLIKQTTMRRESVRQPIARYELTSNRCCAWLPAAAAGLLSGKIPTCRFCLYIKHTRKRPTNNKQTFKNAYFWSRRPKTTSCQTRAFFFSVSGHPCRHIWSRSVLKLWYHEFAPKAPHKPNQHI